MPGSTVTSVRLLWDLPTRLFHWLLVVAVVTSWASIEVFDRVDIHLISGQVVLGLLVFRVLWGVAGSTTAQFRHFVRGPITVLNYLRGRPIVFLGHNPLGALSVVALLVCLLVQVLTGLGSDDEIYTTGPLAKYLTVDQVNLANVVHEWNVRVLLALIALHLVANMYYLLARKKNLIAPMLTGRANESADTAPFVNRLRPAWWSWVAALVAATVAVAVFRL